MDSSGQKTPETGPGPVLLVLVDAMRPDGLRAASTPVMDSLIATGASTFTARTVMPSITLPCITSLFHSSTPEIHGITTNTWAPSADLPPSLFKAARSKERKTASICNWEELRDLGPVGALDVGIYTDNSYESGGTGDRRMAELAVDCIRREPFALTFLYLGHVDVAGHDHGYMSSQYIDAISAADASLGIVIDSLDEDTTIIVMADHGGHDKGHGSDRDEDMLIPVILKGPGIPTGHTIASEVSILDIAPTITGVLGIESPSSWVGQAIPLGGSQGPST